MPCKGHSDIIVQFLTVLCDGKSFEFKQKLVMCNLQFVDLLICKLYYHVTLKS